MKIYVQGHLRKYPLYLFDKYLLINCYVPDARDYYTLDTGETEQMNTNPWSHGTYLPEGGDNQ